MTQNVEIIMTPVKQPTMIVIISQEFIAIAVGENSDLGSKKNCIPSTESSNLFMEQLG